MTSEWCCRPALTAADIADLLLQHSQSRVAEQQPQPRAALAERRDGISLEASFAGDTGSESGPSITDSLIGQALEELRHTRRLHAQQSPHADVQPRAEAAPREPGAAGAEGLLAEALAELMGPARQRARLEAALQQVRVLSWSDGRTLHPAVHITDLYCRHAHRCAAEQSLSSGRRDPERPGSTGQQASCGAHGSFQQPAPVTGTGDRAVSAQPVLCQLPNISHVRVRGPGAARAGRDAQPSDPAAASTISLSWPATTCRRPWCP